MKVGILTFHASHNYGSMLQAYALQQTVTGLGHDCEIINFRTDRQRRFYRPFFINGGLRSKVKAVLYPRIAIDDVRKHRSFERFLREHLQISEREYRTAQQLSEALLPYDAIIAGSDQIWNTSCFDFDRAYFLSFAPSGVRKIAYAPSMGPEPRIQVLKESDRTICKDLTDFAAVSVRESATADRIEHITGKRPEITLDPTLLLSPEQWVALTPQKCIYEKDYILLYTPWYNENIYNEAARFAEKWDMDVVVTLPESSRYWQKKQSHFKFITAVGPLEFLNLVKNARIVVSQSFHAVVFSIMFNRQFYAINGMDDARISNILNMLNLQCFAYRPKHSIDQTIVNTQFARAKEDLKDKIMESLHFLSKSLNA